VISSVRRRAADWANCGPSRGPAYGSASSDSPGDLS
jgi:hypothetical protein